MDVRTAFKWSGGGAMMFSSVYRKFYGMGR
jgi:hypothetical protein